MLATWSWAASPAAAETPVGLVSGFCDVLSEVMRQATTVGQHGRVVRLEAAISRAFDLEAITRDAVGPAWDGMTPASRARLVQAVGHALAVDYASQVDHQEEGQRLVVLPATVQKRDGIMVETRLLAPDADPIERNYLVRQGPGGWRIFDVLLMGGASEQATRRAEFTSVIARRGVDGLISILEELARTPPAAR